MGPYGKLPMVSNFIFLFEQPFIIYLAEGGQAQYVRVPFADFNCLKLPAGTEYEDDFILL